MGHQSLTCGMQLYGDTLVSGNADSTIKVCFTSSASGFLYSKNFIIVTFSTGWKLDGKLKTSFENLPLQAINSLLFFLNASCLLLLYVFDYKTNLNKAIFNFLCLSSKNIEYLLRKIFL